MEFKDWLFWKKRGLKKRLGFSVDSRLHYVANKEEIQDFAAAARGNALAEIFYRNEGRPVQKWAHYLDLYDQHFAPFRSTPCKMLEIGVLQGGSLDLWREYFGPQAVLFGIDIDPECALKVTPPSEVLIGSQDDPDFLRSVVDKMGAPNIILDDGSHVARHQRTSFRTLSFSSCH